VQVRLVALFARLLKVVVQLDHALVLEPLHHLQLAVVVPPVEDHLFDRDALRRPFLHCAPNHPEGSVADHLLHAVATAAALPKLRLRLWHMD